MVNVLLGSVLWTTYGEASERLEPHVPSPIALAAISGALAGGAQAVIAAPAENIRFVLEGTPTATGWSDAWKEVFRGRNNVSKMSKKEQLQEAREVRDWMREVGDMAGRGWVGWKWGVAKDFCGKNGCLGGSDSGSSHPVDRFRPVLFHLRAHSPCRREGQTSYSFADPAQVVGVGCAGEKASTPASRGARSVTCCWWSSCRIGLRAILQAVGRRTQGGSC